MFLDVLNSPNGAVSLTSGKRIIKKTQRGKKANTAAAAQARQTGLCPRSYSQRERNRSYKDKKSKENRLDMRGGKKRE